ncbi:MAG: hypothetical protein Q7S82_00800 [bacterium]|nr:hypothetical protein [bacterium]
MKKRTQFSSPSMILVSHLLVGAAIAEEIKSVPIAIFLALFSHYLLDFLPHSEYSIKNIGEGKWRHSFFDFFKIFLDFSSGVLLILVLAKNPLIALLAGITAILPDGLAFLAFVFPENKLLKIHRAFHHIKTHSFRNKKIPLFWKIISQALTIAVTIIFLLK